MNDRLMCAATAAVAAKGFSIRISLPKIATATQLEPGKHVCNFQPALCGNENARKTAG